MLYSISVSNDLGVIVFFKENLSFSELKQNEDFWEANGNEVVAFQQ